MLEHLTDRFQAAPGAPGHTSSQTAGGHRSPRQSISLHPGPEKKPWAASSFSHPGLLHAADHGSRDASSPRERQVLRCTGVDPGNPEREASKGRRESDSGPFPVQRYGRRTSFYHLRPWDVHPLAEMPFYTEYPKTLQERSHFLGWFTDALTWEDRCSTRRFP